MAGPDAAPPNNSNNAGKFVFVDQDDLTHQRHETVHFSAALLARALILLIGLAEGIFTVFFFDEEEFDFFFVALVIGFFSLFDTIAKSIVYCTETLWDDLAVDLLSESAQAVLYIYFCNASDEALLWLPIMGGTQVLLTLGLFCWARRDDAARRKRQRQKKNDEDEEGEDDEHPDDMVDAAVEEEEDPDAWFLKCCMGCVFKCCGPGCMVVMAAITPILYLLTQDESPFRTKSFEVALTTYLWVVEVSMKASFDVVSDAVTNPALLNNNNNNNNAIPNKNNKKDETELGDDSHAAPADEEDASPAAAQNNNNNGATPAPSPDQAARQMELVVLQILLTVGYIAFFVYLTVLAWIWWLSPEIEDTYDKVVTMLLIVGAALTCCCVCCDCAIKQAAKKDEGEDDDD